MKRWTVGLRGEYSGMIVKLTFLRFWTRAGAARWAERHNRPMTLTTYEVCRR